MKDRLALKVGDTATKIILSGYVLDRYELYAKKEKINIKHDELLFTQFNVSGKGVLNVCLTKDALFLADKDYKSLVFMNIDNFEEEYERLQKVLAINNIDLIIDSAKPDTATTEYRVARGNNEPITFK